MDDGLSTSATQREEATCVLSLAEPAGRQPLLNDRDLRKLGDSLWDRYMSENHADITVLSEAINATQTAVELQPAPGDPELFLLLGERLVARFELESDLDDLDRSISAFRHAVDLTPDGDPSQNGCLTQLGASLYDRYMCLANIEDLEGATTIFRRAVELITTSGISRPGVLQNYGLALQTRFERFGKSEDIEDSISMLRRAVELTPNDNPSQPLRFSNLGNSLLVRFEHEGKLVDLEQAILYQRRAVELTPETDPDKALWLHNLGTSFRTRFEREGEIADIEQAISTHRYAVELTPDNHPSKPQKLSGLGSSLHARFERIEELGDLEHAISAHRRAVELTADTRPEMPKMLNNLGNSLLTHHERTGNLEYLEQAISVYRRAIELTPDHHPAKPWWFGSFGGSLLSRFEHLGELEDLEQAIICYRRITVELTPEDHILKSSWLNNLGISLWLRFEKRRELPDLEDSIEVFHLAVSSAPDDHPNKPGMLTNFCAALRSRYGCNDDFADLERAISAGRRAIELRPEGDPKLVLSYNGLGICFWVRSERTKDPNDIMAAISMLQKTIELTPNNHPTLSSSFMNLAGAQKLLFESTRMQTHFETAIQSYMTSTLQSSGASSIRLESARYCARMLTTYPEFSSSESLLLAYSRIVAILPEVVWFGYGISRRYDESSQLGELVNAAVAAATAAGTFEQAIEWLETGRAIIWSQVLSLRTPLDELEESHPTLADTLRSIRQKLQSTVHTTFAPDIDHFGGVTGITVNSSADRHRGLVIEYDKVLNEIHDCQGFEDFLRPKRFEAFAPLLGIMSGPVVFINVHTSHCDAIILTAGRKATSVPLAELTMKRASQLRLLWTKGLTGYRDRIRDVLPQSELNDGDGCQRVQRLDQDHAFHRHTCRVSEDSDDFVRLLECIWKWIVCPVLQSLEFNRQTRSGSLPHVTWCPTGPLMQLPIHAAGIYSEPFGPRAFDYIVSSYTPSLSALLRCVEGVEKQRPTPSVLVVTQPATPGLSRLPETRAEGLRVQVVMEEAHIASGKYDHDQATVESVRAVMDQYPWVHLACHGSQNRADAMKSAFELYDGPLTLSDLMGTVSNNAELAFLSACQTALGDERTPEESAHLAAGMLAVGFKGVVATMWSIQDADAPIIVEAYYKELLALRGIGGLGKSETGAAYALHEATRVLREKVGKNSFMQWVPFIHFGV